MMMLKSLHAALLLVFVLPLVAQHTDGGAPLAPCGSDVGISPWLRDFQSRIDQTSRNDDMLYLPLQVHVVGRDDGSGYFSRKAVLDAFCTLNADMLQANIQFFMANPINYINNTSYFDHTYQEGREMMQMNNYPNTVNCYIVDSPAGNCGYYTFNRDAIALAKGCLKPDDHTWSHEVGHYLSLPHPFLGWEGIDDYDYSTPAPPTIGGRLVERMDGSNCNAAADGFCDTAPDYLNFRWTCTPDSISSIQQTDPSGTSFFSNGKLIMSYSNDDCVDRFSEDQIAAMRANVEEQRPNLITAPPVLEEITIESPEATPVVHPMQGTLVETASVTLEWEAVPNATHYIVQINPFNIFSIVFEEQLVQGTSAVITDLDVDETYFWRIRPYNHYETCTDFTSPASFNTASVVSTDELKENEMLELFPNPVQNGELQMNIRLNQPKAATWRLINATGAVLQEGDLGIPRTLQRRVLSVANLPAGVYLVQILSADRQLLRKVLIQ